MNYFFGRGICPLGDDIFGSFKNFGFRAPLKIKSWMINNWETSWKERERVKLIIFYRDLSLSSERSFKISERGHDEEKDFL